MATVMDGQAKQGAVHIAQIDMGQPWEWLAAGWRDFMAYPGIALAYGAVLAGIGFLLTLGLWRAELWYLVLPMACGFLIVGPMAAGGLYEVSRRRSAGQSVSLADTFQAYRRNTSQVALMGMALLLFFIAWVRLASLVFMLFFGLNPPSPERFFGEVFFSPGSVVFVAFGFGLGGILAALAYSISVVSIPLLLDRPHSNVIAAIQTSVEAVKRNPRPLLLWGALIALFIGAGMLTLFLGLAVTMPLIAFASWHAYRDLTAPAP